MINRRDAIKTCLGAAATTVVSPLLADDDSGQPVWKTAIGLNGFMSSAKKYGKTYPIWEILDYAARAGFDGVELVQGGPLRGQAIDQAIVHLADSLRQFAKMAHDVGITAAFEIEPPFAFRSEQHLKRILAEADDPRVKTIYDSSHFDLFNGSEGKPHELLERIGVEHIGYVHFTDTDGTIRDGG